MPYGDHLEEGSPRGVSLEPLRKLERVRKQEHDTATHVAALRAAVAREKTARALQRLNASSRSMWSTTDPNRSGTSQSARSPRLPPAGRPNTSQSARH